ncbi:hypothetical protein IMZ48_41140 [Candidatus Bathyarchaeota archaeon]|nr:hypothetical protein [Candidatus Bathyarchaeota archaeon]
MSWRVPRSAVTPMSSWNSSYAVCSHSPPIKIDSRIAPTGSIHHRSLLPPTEVSIPSPLIKRSFRWSRHRISTCE